MVCMSMKCLLYVNSEGLDKTLLDSLKSQVLNGLPSEGEIGHNDVHIEAVTLPYRDLLAKARGIPDLDAGCFYILNKDSADRGAVLCVEVKRHTDIKGMTYRFPSAATTRRFYLHPLVASSMAINLSIANMGWEDFASYFAIGHAQLKRGKGSQSS